MMMSVILCHFYFFDELAKTPAGIEVGSNISTPRQNRIAWEGKAVGTRKTLLSVPKGLKEKARWWIDARRKAQATTLWPTCQDKLRKSEGKREEHIVLAFGGGEENRLGMLSHLSATIGRIKCTHIALGGRRE